MAAAPTASYEVVVEHGDDGAAVALASFLTTYLVLGPLCMAFTAFVVVCSARNLWLQRRFAAPSRRILVFILGTAFFGLITQTLSLLHVGRDWAGHGDGCYISPKAAVSSYVLSNFFCYMFLLERARTTNTLAATKFKFFHPVTFLKFLSYAIYSTPLFAILCAIIVEGQVMIIADAPKLAAPCVLIMDPVVSVFFVVMDTSLSLALLVVFALPVYDVVRHATNNPTFTQTKGVEVMRRVLRANLAASLTAITSTFIMLILLTVGYSRVAATGKLVFFVWSSPLSTFDSTINVAAMATLTSIWLPEGIRILAQRYGFYTIGPQHIVEQDSPSDQQQTPGTTPISGTSNTFAQGRGSNTALPSSRGAPGASISNEFDDEDLEDDSSMEFRPTFVSDSTLDGQSTASFARIQSLSPAGPGTRSVDL